MKYARVVVVLHFYSLEQCPSPVLRTSIKTCNFVTFYEFLIHLGMHHTVNLTNDCCSVMYMNSFNMALPSGYVRYSTKVEFPRFQS
jgi:hypothetical protein